MKKIINGALYNTETAKQIGYKDNGLMENDFNYCCESLYLTKAGKYFLHGEGHGNSKYGEWHGNTGGWGEQIRPYTAEEARQWAEDHLTADEYSEAFGEPDEASDTKVVTSISILKSTSVILQRLKEQSGGTKSFGQLIDEAFADK